jgi:hypothetical protein
MELEDCCIGKKLEEAVSNLEDVDFFTKQDNTRIRKLVKDDR